jgi:hypothetical protein
MQTDAFQVNAAFVISPLLCATLRTNRKGQNFAEMPSAFIRVHPRPSAFISG